MANPNDIAATRVARWRPLVGSRVLYLVCPYNPNSIYSVVTVLFCEQSNTESFILVTSVFISHAARLHASSCSDHRVPVPITSGLLTDRYCHGSALFPGGWSNETGSTPPTG